MQINKAGHPHILEFLCTKVKIPDTDDYKKLMHVMQYLRGTQDLTLTREPYDHPNWWVDSSYTMHPDMQNISGIYETGERGYMHWIAQAGTKHQKLHRSRAGSDSWCHGANTVDTSFLWYKASMYPQEKNASLECKIIFCYQQKKKRPFESSILPCAGHAGRFLYKTSTGHPLHADARKNLPASISTSIHRSVLEDWNKNGINEKNIRGGK